MAQSVVDLFQQLARNEFGFFTRLQSVTELMSTSVPTVSSEVSIGDVIDRRDPVTMSSFAVVDSTKGDLLGVLKQSTVLRCLPRYLNTLKEGDRDRAILTTNVCDLMSRRSAHIGPSATPLEALEMMMQKESDFLLVYDSPHELRGVITPVSFANTMLLYYRVFQQQQPLQRLRLVDLDSNLSLDEIFCRGAQTARDVMNTPVAISSREPVAAAITLMSANCVQHLPVLDDRKQVTGIISQNDILIALQPPCRTNPADDACGLPVLEELLASDHEPTLSEPVSNIAKSRVISVAPTSRLAETLTKLTETGRDAVLVQDEGQLVGIVTLSDILRVFRTLMRLQLIKDR